LLALASYLAVLQLSRAALLASAHHLQPPAGPAAWARPGYFLGLCLAPGLATAGLLGVAFANPLRAPAFLSLSTQAEEAGARRLWALHAAAALLATTALAPL
jgi:hypothetical protein